MKKWKQRKMITNEDVKLYKRLQQSPILFIEKMWQIKPQEVKAEYEQVVKEAIEQGNWSLVKKEHFQNFEKGKHITWQQWLLLLAIERGLKGLAPKRITVSSGHGCGKSATLSWLIIWYLFCFKDAQVPCTAPTSDQIHDILWKELALWKDRLPEPIKQKYDWTTGYLRINERPETWFARAKTARKENPEALAGIHGDYVMAIIDEASGVPEEIYKTAEGALTGENVLVVMVSNATRLLGYFYDSHTRDKQSWQNLVFSSEDSPIVESGYVERMERKHGKDSDEYRIRVLGQFPKEDAIDSKGYVSLLTESDIRITTNSKFVGEKKLGVDCGGEGLDESSWVMRDFFKAQVVASQKTSTPASIAQTTLTLMLVSDIKGHNVTVDNFGVGANVSREVALAGEYIEAVNVGDKADDDERFLNKRAESYWRMREWLKKGGEIVDNPKLVEELLSIRYKRNLRGKIQIMSKEEMRKEGYVSPNRADALMLTFYDDSGIYTKNETTNLQEESNEHIHEGI